jgi:cysteinyl-tRNA synthetase
VLGTHYRNPLEFSEDRLREAARSLERFSILFADADRLAAPGAPASGSDGAVASDRGLTDEMAALRARFEAAMDEDFNTPEARAVLFDMASALHAYWRLVERGERPAGSFLLGVNELRTLGRSLGLFQPTTRSITASDTLAVGLSEVTHLGVPAETRARADALAVERDEARRRRDWKRADALREELQALGATIEDTPGGTRLRWR